MRRKTSLIVGGSGQLGKHIVDVFKQRGWKVLSMDFRAHDKADENVILDSN
jgi:NAD(P)-dependent dehydrogenase (short-subunit alcohol dehydrogenase family)